ncbi:MAG: DNA repair protein RadC [Bacteroidia bacterium]|jgi:DNA repair protein RadC
MSNYISIKDRAVDERPREKLQLHGKQNLSNSELLGILIGTGTKNKSAVDVGREVLIKADNDLNKLAGLSIPELCKVDGIGIAKAITLISAIELGGRRTSQSIAVTKTITSSKDAYHYIGHKIADLIHEEFWVIFLNRANHITSSTCISKGGFSQTVVDPKLVFKSALEAKASAILLCHNHPSGNLKPSKADLSLTEKIKSGGKLLEIQVLDHLIVTSAHYLSFADEGLM